MDLPIDDGEVVSRSQDFPPYRKGFGVFLSPKDQVLGGYPYRYLSERRQGEERVKQSRHANSAWVGRQFRTGGVTIPHRCLPASPVTTPSPGPRTPDPVRPCTDPATGRSERPTGAGTRLR